MMDEREAFMIETYGAMLTPDERRIVAHLANEGPTSSLDLLIAYKAGGWPEYGTGAIRVHVSRARAKLEPLGWTIARCGGGVSPAEGGGALGNWAIYELRRVEHAKR
ncbi:MAG: helix-turn-helix domain-containing protein [Novosphingobium sp.]